MRPAHLWTAVLMAVLVAMPAVVTAGPETARILGGTTARPGLWPTAVALLDATVADNRDAQFCGGTLVHEEWVLTAASCVETLGVTLLPADVEALLRSTNLNVGGTRAGIDAIAVHPDYDAVDLGGTGAFDAALLHMPVGAPDLGAIPLATPMQLPGFAKGKGIAPGWGCSNTIPNPLSGEPCTSKGNPLQQVSLSLVAPKDCAAIYPTLFVPVTFASDFLCAGEKKGRIDTCVGDEGGPLFVKTPEAGWVQAGITSAVSCGTPGLPGLYTAIPSVQGWVQDLVGEYMGPPVGSEFIVRKTAAWVEELTITFGPVAAPFAVCNYDIVGGGIFTCSEPAGNLILPPQSNPLRLFVVPGEVVVTVQAVDEFDVPQSAPVASKAKFSAGKVINLVPKLVPAAGLMELPKRHGLAAVIQMDFQDGFGVDQCWFNVSPNPVTVAGGLVLVAPDEVVCLGLLGIDTARFPFLYVPAAVGGSPYLVTFTGLDSNGDPFTDPFALPLTFKPGGILKTNPKLVPTGAAVGVKAPKVTEGILTVSFTPSPLLPGPAGFCVMDFELLNTECTSTDGVIRPAVFPFIVLPEGTYTLSASMEVDGLLLEDAGKSMVLGAHKVSSYAPKFA